MKKITLMIIALMLVFALILQGCSGKTADSGKDAAETTTSEDTAETTTSEEDLDPDAIDPYILEVREPLIPYRGEIPEWVESTDGEKPVWDTELVLTNAEVAKLRKGKEDGTAYTVAISQSMGVGMHEKSLLRGFNDAIQHLGMKTVAQTGSMGQVEKEANDIESYLSLKPDVVIAAAIDKQASAQTFRKVLESGAKLGIWSNAPEGFKHGVDYNGIVTQAYLTGQHTAELLGKSVSENAKIGIINFGGNQWLLNTTDKAVREYLEKNYPGLQIVDVRERMAYEEVNDIALAMLQEHPDMEGMYVSVMVAAEWASRAIRTLGIPTDKIAISSFGLDETTIIDILEGGYIKGTVTDCPYYIGFNLGILAGYNAIGKKAPPIVLTPSLPITKENFEEIWPISERIPIPDKIKEVMERQKK